MTVKQLEEAEYLPPFQGGVLAYHPNHIELSGEVIAEKSRRGYAWQSPQVLRQTNGNGKPVQLGSRSLARKQNPKPEQNTAIRAVCTLRSRITKIVRCRLGHECTQNDVLANDEQGDHLANGIFVEVFDEQGT